MRIVLGLGLALMFPQLVACGDSASPVGVDTLDSSSPGPNDDKPTRPSDAGTRPQAPLDAARPTPPADGGKVQPSDAASPRDAGLSWDAALPAADAGPGALQLLIVDGKTVTVFIPDTVDKKKPIPAVFSLHGLSIPAVAMVDVTGLDPVAEKEGFIAIYPDGTSGTWNTGGAICGLGSFVGNSADDVAYVEHILAEVEKQQAVDRTRVFMSGFSMGGYGTNALGCGHPELFRAVAPASGGFPTAPCGAGPVPAIIFHGTSDGTISYDCGKGARDAWVAHNGCSTEVDVTPVMGGHCERNRGCPAHGQVVFCSFDGMGHGWAGSLDPFALGGPQYESATSLMWAFFKEQL